MSKRKLPQRASIPELTKHMLTSIMPTADDPRDCLMGLGVKAGDEVTIGCEGGDEAAAAAALEQFFKENL